MSRENATTGLVEATRIALLEIAEILEPYTEAVIVGGTVPFLLVPQTVEAHEGTVDIDIVLALDQRGANDVYTLHETLERRLFTQNTRKPFRYTKSISIDGEVFEVLIELLGGGDPPPGGLHRIETEDVRVSIIKGMEVALENPRLVSLPDHRDRSVSVASLPAFLAMKAMALQQRDEQKKAKDAYDIVYCLRNYPGGVGAIWEEFQVVLSHPIIRAGPELLRELFSSPDAVGPAAYARGATEPEEAELMRREAVERVHELLARLSL